MNISRILVPALWLVSLAAAFVIGGKIKTTSDASSTDAENTSTRRPAHRQSADSSADSPQKRSSGNRVGRTTPASKRELDITTISKNTDPIARANDLLRLINRLGVNDFAQVVADFRELGITRERMSEYGMLLHAWAKVDPLGALDYAEKNTGTPYARQTILTSWAGNDLDGALLWAESHHQGEGANPWLVGVIRGVASSDPTRATEIMQTLPYSRERGDALSSLIPHIASQGIEKASLWLNTITDERLLNGSTSRLASALAKTDPQGTADWVASLTDSDGKSRALREVAERWAEQDVASAVIWSNTLTGETKINATREIMGEYAQEDPAQAAAWLSSMTRDPGYGKIVESYIWHAARQNPTMALAQIPEIQNPKSQERYYERVLRNWRHQNATAAEAWINNNELPENVLKKVTRPNNSDHRRR
jgi:hypothetical protein